MTDAPPGHPERVPGKWFACEYPERPGDKGTYYFSSGCTACRIKAAVDLAAQGDFLVLDLWTNEVVPMRDALALERHREAVALRGAK